MATLLLPAGPAARETETGTATRIIVLSPIRGADGQLHVERCSIPAAQSVQAALPSEGSWERVVWNGAVLSAESQALVILQPGDEVWVFPRWGVPAVVAPFLIYAAVGLAVSVAATALSYVLFPPQKPHLTPPDERTYSFSGIQTAIGPGNVVPVIYGRHRVGGQLLAAAVEQVLTVVDTGATVTQVTAISEPPTLQMLVAVGEGEVDNILVDSVEMNGQPLANFRGIGLATRAGTIPQAVIPNFNEIRNTFADGRQLPDNSSNTDITIVYTTNEPVTAFVLNIVFNEGLYQINGKGQKEDNTVNLAYRYKPTSSGAWSPYFVFQVSAQRTAPVRFGIRRENLPFDTYDIAVNYGGVRHADDLHAKWIPTLESVTQCQANTQTYDGTGLLALRAVATDTLQGSLPNLTVEVRGKKVRISTFNRGGEQWSDNPAWCTMDFMTDSRYGLGIPDAEIDLAAFQAWADYCDEIIEGERRHTFNYVLDRDMRAQAVLLEMMGGSRTILLKSEGLWTPRPTRNTAPVQLLSWTSCTNVKVTYTRDADRVNVMEARFANEDEQFEQDVLTWPAIDQWPPEVHKASLDIRGVTKPSRIMRALQFELNRRRFENCLLEMECSLDAVVLQVHDVFRFSHPLPGWGVSGRIATGSDTTTVVLDQPVTMIPGQNYQLYVKFNTDYTEARPLVNDGITTTVVRAAFPFTGAPQDRVSVWAFGLSSPDTAVKLFRVTKLQRHSDTTVHLEAVIHNPTIYDEPMATPLPITSNLFNPLGPPPPLTTLIVTELVRIQASGASAHVANLSWDIGPLGPGFAPYGGAHIQRRTVLTSSSAGLGEAGTQDLAGLQSDSNVNYVTIQTVTGHVLDYDDYTVLSGTTYVYRVVPISGRSIPNEAGALEAVIHMSGGTGLEYFPGTVARLRLLGQPVGAPFWEGRDVHVEWDPVPDPGGLFSTTFFVTDYMVQVWAPGQEYLLRSIFVTARQFHYTFEQNIEDQAHAGKGGARRDMVFFVWARTNTGRISLNPASMAVSNPPPDMSDIDLDTTALFEAALIKWDQYREPRDFDHYEIHIDVVNPPIAIYQDVSSAFHGVGGNNRNVAPVGLVAGQTYYVYVLPFDTFGPGIPTDTESFVPGNITTGQLDTTPPSTPTGLVLTTGTEVNPDGTIGTWVEASWTPSPESDVAGYEVHFTVLPSTVPTTYSCDKSQHTIHVPVPGNVTVHVKLLAFDKVHNVSPFTAEAEITTGRDTTPPGRPQLVVTGSSIKAIPVFWTPPPDLDYAYGQVVSSTTNDRNTASLVGTGLHTFVHEGLGPNEIRYYWVRSVDTSGNVSVDFTPVSATAGVQGTAGLLDSQYIANLSADKIIAGTIQALVSLGVGNTVLLDGVNTAISVYDQLGHVRGLFGKLGAGSTQYGLQLFDETGAVMWDFFTGVQTAGIRDQAVNAAKITIGTLTGQQMNTEVLLVTKGAQIANAIITDAHIASVTADKITTGYLRATYSVGVGPGIVIDGPNRNFQVYDEGGTLRIAMGHLAGGPLDYGLMMWNALGQLMLDFNTGASTFGIQDLAITNAKIANAAITNAKIGNLEVDNAKIANLTVGTGKIANNAISASILFAGNGGGGIGTSETEFARVTLNLLAGDQVLLIGTCTVLGAGQAGSASLLLREDSTTGTLHHQADALQTGADASSRQSLTVETVYVAPGAITGKVFLLTGLGIAAFGSVRLAVLQLHK